MADNQVHSRPIRLIPVVNDLKCRNSIRKRRFHAIYVTNAGVYEWQKIISAIVQVLVLGRTADALGR